MDRTATVVTPERYASGMNFEQYLRYIASPENLRREGSGDGEPRRDGSGWVRGGGGGAAGPGGGWSGWVGSWYDSRRLSSAQTAAIRWLAAQPNGPRRIL